MNFIPGCWLRLFSIAAESSKSMILDHLTGIAFLPLFFGNILSWFGIYSPFYWENGFGGSGSSESDCSRSSILVCSLCRFYDPAVALAMPYGFSCLSAGFSLDSSIISIAAIRFYYSGF